jgi:hypothetical protein
MFKVINKKRVFTYYLKINDYMNQYNNQFSNHVNSIILILFNIFSV